jgi:hypothetical protein
MRQKMLQQGSKENVTRVQIRSQPLSAVHKPQPHGVAASLLNLQRTHGNRFVQQFLNAGVIQRKCTCGGTCAKCQSESMHHDLKEGKKAAPASKPTQSASTKGQKGREACDEKCGKAGPFGSTECEISLKTGLPTGKVTKEIFDKNPCTRPCVEVHESTHAKNIMPICKDVHKCLDKVGGDTNKQDKCLDNYESDLRAIIPSTECEAYKAEEKCLEKRKTKPECVTTDGKNRWNTQMDMVKCYKDCFCSA